MNTPNYPPQPPSGPYGNNPQQPGPYGPPGGQQPYGQRPPQPPPPSGQPYGGPPPGGFGPPPPTGQPYGGPPPGGPGGTPPAGYPTPPAPDPSAKPSNTGKIIKIVGGLVVVGIVIVAIIYFQGKSASSANVGECIKVNSASTTDADVEKIDCNSNDAVYKVAVTEDSSTASCPDGDYVSYTESGSGDLTLCLILNAKEGECFHEGTNDDTRVDCASSEATYKVIQIIDGKNDVNACGEQAQAGLVYSEPKRTICVAAPDGGGTT